MIRGLVLTLLFLFTLTGCAGSGFLSRPDARDDAATAHQQHLEEHQRAHEEHVRLHEEAVRQHAETANPTFPTPPPPPPAP